MFVYYTLFLVFLELYYAKLLETLVTLFYCSRRNLKGYFELNLLYGLISNSILEIPYNNLPTFPIKCFLKQSEPKMSLLPLDFPLGEAPLETGSIPRVNNHSLLDFSNFALPRNSFPLTKNAVALNSL